VELKVISACGCIQLLVSKKGERGGEGGNRCGARGGGGGKKEGGDIRVVPYVINPARKGRGKI